MAVHTGPPISIPGSDPIGKQCKACGCFDLFKRIDRHDGVIAKCMECWDEVFTPSAPGTGDI